MNLTKLKEELLKTGGKIGLQVEEETAKELTLQELMIGSISLIILMKITLGLEAISQISTVRTILKSTTWRLISRQMNK